MLKERTYKENYAEIFLSESTKEVKKLKVRSQPKASRKRFQNDRALKGENRTDTLLCDVICCLEHCCQPGSQGLSSLPPLVIGIKTLVAAGHVTTQNLGGKNICWVGGVAECLDCCCGKLCGFQNLEQSLKTTRFIGA